MKQIIKILGDTLRIKFGGNRYVRQSPFAVTPGKVSHPISILPLDIYSTPKHFETQSIARHLALLIAETKS